MIYQNEQHDRISPSNVGKEKQMCESGQNTFFSAIRLCAFIRNPFGCVVIL